MALTATASIALVMGGFLAFRALNQVVKTYMLRLLGDHWFEYAAMFYWILLSVAALFIFLLFVVPFWVWVLAFLGTFVVGAVIAELAC